MTEPIDDQVTFWWRFARDGHAPPVTNRLRNELENDPWHWGWLRAEWEKWLADMAPPIPRYVDMLQATPPALRGSSSSVPPNGTAVEEERSLADIIESEFERARLDQAALKSAHDQLLGDLAAIRKPVGILAALTETEEQRVAHELVPLVRAASDEVPLPPRVDVLGGHLRTSRTADDALHQHVSDFRWARYQVEHREGEARAFSAYIDRVLDSTLVAQPPASHPDDDLYTTVMAAYAKMLAPSSPPRRTEPIKLTREQIDEIPRAPGLEPFVPHTPAAVLLDGVPVVEVLTVEESTPHVEGWRLTISQIITGVYSAFDGAQPDYRKPLHMTRQQIERVMNLLGYERPDDWEQTLERGGEVSQLLGRPVHLAHNAASSTPCIERWMDL